MKKIGTLNRHLSRVIASMGHEDRLIVCDSGLPIPHNGEVVDLALTDNIPGFLETVRVILEELFVEKAVVASEMQEVSPAVYDQLCNLLDGTDIEAVPHDEFKDMTTAVPNTTFVRTGEMTPFANVLLSSGVTFG
jgi:D-ribose pyranase